MTDIVRPGQIELYTHFPVMKTIKEFLSRLGYNMCAVYLMDSQFVEDSERPFHLILNHIPHPVSFSCQVSLWGAERVVDDGAARTSPHQCLDKDGSL